jgi:hypothetical protein
MALTDWVCKFMQAALKLAGGEKWHAAFLKAFTGTGFSLVGCSYVFHGLGVQYVILFNFV